MVEKTVDLTGTSTIGIEDAVALAVKRASVTIKNIRHARVMDAVALIEQNAIARWRVRVEITFAVEDQLHE
jgi:flavin-binding protein dodecin